jgi:hypothetical protein
MCRYYQTAKRHGGWPGGEAPPCECGSNRGGDCDGNILPSVAAAQGLMTEEADAFRAGRDAFYDGHPVDALAGSVDDDLLHIAITAWLASEWAETVPLPVFSGKVDDVPALVEKYAKRWRDMADIAESIHRAVGKR